MITAIFGMITYLASHAWMLLIAILPAILGFLNPVLSAITDGVKNFTATVWQGASEAKWPQWLLVLTVSLITAVIGYKYGWDRCLDWVHAHFRLVSKVPVSHWWKLW